MGTAEAMENATKLADEGSLSDGRDLLLKQLEVLKCAPSAPQCAYLLEDLENAQSGFDDEVRYRAQGSKFTKMSAQSNMQQRSTHAAGKAYARKGKKGMMAHWSKAMAEEE